jgi:hypothetical protein
MNAKFFERIDIVSGMVLEKGIDLICIQQRKGF